MRAGDQAAHLHSTEAAWHAEYVFRHEVVPGLSHEQYLDEPGDSIQWLMRVHGLYKADEERRSKER